MVSSIGHGTELGILGRKLTALSRRCRASAPVRSRPAQSFSKTTFPLRRALPSGPTTTMQHVSFRGGFDLGPLVAGPGHVIAFPVQPHDAIEFVGMDPSTLHRAQLPVLRPCPRRVVAQFAPRAHQPRVAPMYEMWTVIFAVVRALTQRKRAMLPNRFFSS